MRHRLPFPVATLVLPHIIHFREQKPSYRDYIDDNQIPVAASVQWLVVLAVDIRADNTSALNHHIVECRGDGAGTDVV